MQDDTRRAEALNHHIDQHRTGHQPPPESEEIALATDLRQLAESIQPDAAFLARLESRLKPPAPGLNGHVHKEQPMTTFTLPTRRPTRLNLSPFMLAGIIILLAVLVGVVIPFAVPPIPQSTTGQILVATPLPADDLSPLEYGGALTDFNPATLDRLRAAGMTWVHVPLPYQSDFTRDGTEYRQHEGITLALAQSVITAAQGAGFKIAVTVVGSRDDIGIATAPAEPGALIFSGTMLKLFAAIARLGPDAIQVWQEPNLDRFWPTGKISGTTYASIMLRLTYNAIKEANPNVLVIAATPAPTDVQSAFPGQIVNDDVFYQGMAEAGVAQYADCIGMAYVQGAVPPDQTSGDPRGDTPLRFLPTMLERAYAPFRGTGLPVCVTSLGYLSAEGLPEPMGIPFSWANETSAAEQAQWTAEAIRYLGTQDIAPVRLVLLTPMNALTADPADQAMAIIRPDGSCPTCDALEARIAVQQGTDAYNSRNYAGAIDHFARCEELVSTDVQCYSLRGLAHFFLAQPGNSNCELAWEYLNRASAMPGLDEYHRSDIEAGLRLVGQSCPQFGGATVTLAPIDLPPMMTATP